MILSGPRRPLGGFGVLRVEAFPTLSGYPLIGAWDPYGSDSDDDDEEGEWDPYGSDSDETKIRVQRFGGLFGRMIEITYLLIPNAIEAEVKVRMLPVLGTYDYCLLSGMIKACAGGDYGGHNVSLFAPTEPKLILNPSHECFDGSLHLSPANICLPYRPHLELQLEVDLRLCYGENVSNIISNMKFTPGTGRLITEADGNILEICVTMHPS